MTRRLEDQIERYTSALDAAAPPLEVLMPDALFEAERAKPRLVLIATISGSRTRFHTWQYALVSAVAIVTLLVPAWYLAQTMGDSQEVVSSPTSSEQEPASTTPRTELASAQSSTTASTPLNVVVNPENGHVFEAVAVPGGVTWDEAREAAGARTRDGASGHLATFTSASEYLLVVDNLPQAFAAGPGENPYWIGGFQPSDSPEPGGGWSWVTGEPFTYFPWAAGEPNDSVEDEACLHPHHDQALSPLWNDQPCSARVDGYLVEYEPER